MRLDKDGHVMMYVQVVSHAPKTQVDGLHGEEGQLALKIRLQAPPIDGKANEALVGWLASKLGITRISMEMVRGQTSRRKQLQLSAETAPKAKWGQLTKQRPDRRLIEGRPACSSDHPDTQS